MEERSELKRQVDAGSASNESDTQKGKYMTFKSGNEFFGLEIQYVNAVSYTHLTLPTNSLV